MISVDRNKVTRGHMQSATEIKILLTLIQIIGFILIEMLFCFSKVTFIVI